MRPLVVFDLDGTLVDSRRDLAESANQLLEELGGPPLPVPQIGAMVGDGAAMLVRRALAAAGLADTPSALPRFLDIYDGRLLNHTHAYEGVADAVIAARRHARTAVLTNKPEAPSRRILDGLGLSALFDDLIGGDGPWPRKPDPASLLALIQCAGSTAGTTLLVGDSVVDQETAACAGVRCCLASWGFGYEVFPPGRLTGQEWVAASTADLIVLLDRFFATC